MSQNPGKEKYIFIKWQIETRIRSLERKNWHRIENKRLKEYLIFKEFNLRQLWFKRGKNDKTGGKGKKNGQKANLLPAVKPGGLW